MFPPNNLVSPDANLVPSQQTAQIPFPTTSQSVRSPQVEATAGKKKQVEDDGKIERDLLQEARQRFRTIVENRAKFDRAAIEELNFTDNLNHWKPEQKEERKGLPCLSADKIGPACDQVVNAMRQQPPEGRVTPVGEGADKQEAEILQGMLRNIDQDSGADIAHTTAYEHAVKIGIGWWRETFDWESDVTDDDSLQRVFYQKLVTRRITNPFSVYCDPAAQEHDRSDMRYLFATEDLDQVAFTDEYPDASTRVTGDFSSVISDKEKADWFPNGKSIRVAEYWWVEQQPAEVVLMMSDGRVVREAEWRAAQSNIPTDSGAPWEVGRRKIRRRVVKMAKLTGVEVLGKVMEWKGKWIPFVPVLGREVLVDGRPSLRGMIRPAMESNLAYDYMLSKLMQAVALAPISDFVALAGKVDNHPEWLEANRKPHGILKFDAVELPNGTVDANPPQRVNTEANIVALMQSLQHFDQDTRTALNTWGPQLGEPASSQSGKAIRAIQSQGDNAHFNYSDNLARSIRHATRIRLDLMPHVYSEERMVAITDPDGKVRSVKINAKILQDGIEKIWRVGADYKPSRYDVTIVTGPSYPNKVAQQTDTLIEMFRTAPAALMPALYLIAEYMGLPQKICDALRPPNVAAEQDAQYGQPNVQGMQAKIAQMGEMIKALSEASEKLAEEKRIKKLEWDSKEKIEARHDLTRIRIAEIGTQSAENRQLAQLDHDGVVRTLEMAAAEPPEASASQGQPQPQTPQAQPELTPAMEPQPGMFPEA
jgi:hypothetical protein